MILCSPLTLMMNKIYLAEEGITIQSITLNPVVFLTHLVIVMEIVVKKKNVKKKRTKMMDLKKKLNYVGDAENVLLNLNIDKRRVIVTSVTLIPYKFAFIK